MLCKNEGQAPLPYGTDRSHMVKILDEMGAVCFEDLRINYIYIAIHVLHISSMYSYLNTEVISHTQYISSLIYVFYIIIIYRRAPNHIMNSTG